MVNKEVRCIHCNSKNVSKMGKRSNRTLRCKCKNCGKTFQTKYISNGASPATKAMIKKMALLFPIISYKPAKGILRKSS